MSTTQYGIIPCKVNIKVAVAFENYMKNVISTEGKKFNLPANTSSLKFIVLDALLMPPLVK